MTQEEYKTFAELVPGDVLVGSQGQPVTVTKVHESHLPKTMFEIVVEEEGQEKTIEVSGNHLWYVETIVDVATHSQRLRAASKALKKLAPRAKEELLAYAQEEEEVELSLQEAVALLRGVPPQEAERIAIRVAESLGPILEETKTYQDMLTEEEMTSTTVRFYCRRLFAQQLLALASKRYRRRWPVVRGRVVTTEMLALLSSIADLPTVEKL